MGLLVAKYDHKQNKLQIKILREATVDEAGRLKKKSSKVKPLFYKAPNIFA